MLSGIWTAVGLHNSRLALAVWLLLWSAQVASVSSGSDDSCNTPGGIIYVVQLAGQGCMAIQAACKCVCGKKCQHLLTVHSGIASHLFGADYIAAELKLSASVAAGLINRHMQAPTVVTMLLPTDQSSAASARAEESTMRSCTWSELTVPELWRLAYTTGASTGTVLYDPQEPWSLATVITLCGVHQALPVASTQQQVAKQTWLHSWLHTALAALQRYALSRLRGILQFGVFVQNGYPAMTQKWDTYFDTRGLWANSFQATSWAYDNLFNSCKQTHETVVIQVPDLMRQGLLADFVVARQMFAFWLPDLCQSGNPAHKLFRNVTHAAWQKQSLLTVMGYFAAQEEIAACSQHHTEIALVSDWSPNLLFWSQMAPVTTLLQPSVPPKQSYSPNKTYVAVIASDGDSLQMNYNSMRAMMDERHAIPAACAPRQAASRPGKDSFLMGPSGFGFLHPSAIASGDPLREAMIKLTAAAADQLDMTAYVHWDEYNNAEGTDHRSASGLPCMQEAKTKAWQNCTGVASNSESIWNCSRVRSEHLMHSQHGSVLCSRADLLNSAVPAVGTIAMEEYIASFGNTSIQAVFSPITPYVHQWIGDIVTFRELIRWTASQTESPLSIADMLQDLPAGSLGYVHKLPDITMQSVEALGDALRNSHVELVGHRELASLAALQSTFT